MIFQWLFPRPVAPGFKSATRFTSVQVSVQVIKNCQIDHIECFERASMSIECHFDQDIPNRKDGIIIIREERLSIHICLSTERLVQDRDKKK